MKQQLLTLKPYVPGFNQDVAELLWVNGENDAAIAELNDLPSGAAVSAPRDLAMVYAAMGRYNKAADTFAGSGERY